MSASWSVSEDHMQDKYARKSREFLTQAREELDKGDLVQASEKLWGGLCADGQDSRAAARLAAQ